MLQLALVIIALALLPTALLVVGYLLFGIGMVVVAPFVALYELFSGLTRRVPYWWLWLLGVMAALNLSEGTPQGRGGATLLVGTGLLVGLLVAVVKFIRRPTLWWRLGRWVGRWWRHASHTTLRILLVAAALLLFTAAGASAEWHWYSTERTDAEFLTVDRPECMAVARIPPATVETKEQRQVFSTCLNRRGWVLRDGEKKLYWVPPGWTGSDASEAAQEVRHAWFRNVKATCLASGQFSSCMTDAGWRLVHEPAGGWKIAPPAPPTTVYVPMPLYVPMPHFTHMPGPFDWASGASRFQGGITCTTSNGMGVGPTVTTCE